MAQKPEARQFNFGTAVSEVELITPGIYKGTIEQARYVQMADTTERLWVGVRLDNNRFVTTLCPTSDVAKAAYKTKGLIVALASHLGGVFLPADAELLVGGSLDVDVVKWVPQNSGVAVNDIRGFAKSKVVGKAKVDEMIADLAEDLSSK
jgi:hypothetical protein